MIDLLIGLAAISAAFASAACTAPSVLSTVASLWSSSRAHRDAEAAARVQEDAGKRKDRPS